MDLYWPSKRSRPNMKTANKVAGALAQRKESKMTDGDGGGGLPSEERITAGRGGGCFRSPTRCPFPASGRLMPSSLSPTEIINEVNLFFIW